MVGSGEYEETCVAVSTFNFNFFIYLADNYFGSGNAHERKLLSIVCHAGLFLKRLLPKSVANIHALVR
jgi:hypothetical protein